MVHHVYGVVAQGGGWAVQHLGKVLDVYSTQDEAKAAVERLARLTQASGHDAEVIVTGAAGEVRSDQIYPRYEG